MQNKILIKEGFSIPHAEKRKVICINADNVLKSIEHIKRNNIKDIHIDFGESKSDLHFLKEITFIESLEVTETTVDNCNLSILNMLKNLSSLSLYGKIKYPIDFGNFKNLLYCNITVNKFTIDLYKCTELRFFDLWDYKGDDLSAFYELSNLEKFNIFNSSIVSLRGLEKLTRLKKITLERLANLSEIESLVSVANTLEELAIRNCKMLNDYNVIKDLVHLKTIFIIKSGNAESSSFLKNLNELTYGSIDINILDGNVDVLMNKPIIFKTYKHFSHKNTLKIKGVMNEGNYLMRGKDILYKL